MEALTEYMQRTGQAFKQIAGVLEVSIPMVHHLSTGKRKPSPKLARLMNEKLGIPLYKLRPDIWPQRGPQ